MREIIQDHFEKNADKIDDELKVIRGRATIYANRRLKSWPDAEDCVQEAYCRALSYSDGFKEGSDFDCWFFIILANVVNNCMYKKDNSPEMISIDEEVLTEEEEPYYILKDMSFIDRIDSLDCSLLERSILNFYFKYGHKASHISDILQVSLSVVRGILTKYSRPELA
jgi:RNA polymerase sigma factor (sigma-70 family)